MDSHRSLGDGAVKIARRPPAPQQKLSFLSWLVSVSVALAFLNLQNYHAGALCHGTDGGFQRGCPLLIVRRVGSPGGLPCSESVRWGRGLARFKSSQLEVTIFIGQPSIVTPGQKNSEPEIRSTLFRKGWDHIDPNQNWWRLCKTVLSHSKGSMLHVWLSPTPLSKSARLSEFHNWQLCVPFCKCCTSHFANKSSTCQWYKWLQKDPSKNRKAQREKRETCPLQPAADLQITELKSSSRGSATVLLWPFENIKKWLPGAQAKQVAKQLTKQYLQGDRKK